MSRFLKILSGEIVAVLLVVVSPGFTDQDVAIAKANRRLALAQTEGRVGALSLNHCPLKAVLNCGMTVTSALTTASCMSPSVNSPGERYTFQATNGQIVGIEMSSTDFTTFPIVSGPPNAPFLFLVTANTLSYRSSGRSVERMDFYVPTTGTYTLQALALYGPGDTQPWTGQYTVTMSCVTTPPTCVNANTLCLNAGRFQVTLLARDQRSGQSGAGVALPSNDLFGYFSIPALTNNPANPEVFVKILDGRPVNGNFWVFYNGLTDLQFTAIVLDTATGRTKTYEKAAGSACGGFDTSAF